MPLRHSRREEGGALRAVAAASSQLGSREARASSGARDAVLVVVRNEQSSRQDALRVEAQSWNPLSRSFLDCMAADVAPGGACAFAASLSSDLLLDLGDGPRRLVTSAGGGAPRFEPATPGVEQRCLEDEAFAWRVVVVVTAAPLLRPRGSAEALEDLLEDSHGVFREAWRRAELRLPDAYSVFAPPDDALSDDVKAALLVEPLLLRHFVADGALFFKRGGPAPLLDGASAYVEVAVGGLLVTLPPCAAAAELPELRLRAQQGPLRGSDRFRLLYPLHAATAVLQPR